MLKLKVTLALPVLCLFGSGLAKPEGASDVGGPILGWSTAREVLTEVLNRLTDLDIHVNRINMAGKGKDQVDGKVYDEVAEQISKLVKNLSLPDPSGSATVTPAVSPQTPGTPPRQRHIFRLLKEIGEEYLENDFRTGLLADVNRLWCRHFGCNRDVPHSNDERTRTEEVLATLERSWITVVGEGARYSRSFEIEDAFKRRLKWLIRRALRSAHDSSPEFFPGHPNNVYWRSALLNLQPTDQALASPGGSFCGGLIETVDGAEDGSEQVYRDLIARKLIQVEWSGSFNEAGGKLENVRWHPEPEWTETGADQVYPRATAADRRKQQQFSVVPASWRSPAVRWGQLAG